MNSARPERFLGMTKMSTTRQNGPAWGLCSFPERSTWWLRAVLVGVDATSVPPLPLFPPPLYLPLHPFLREHRQLTGRRRLLQP
eukprot:359595-Chlamydomonas_euryale.AAC.5